MVNSSYSLEIICTSSCYSRNACLENVSTLNPDVTDTELEHFSPVDYEYHFTSISLGDANYFNSFSESSESSNSDTDSDEQKPYLIKHDPDTLWGYDDKELVIAAVIDFEMANYQWYKDGNEMQNLSGINKNAFPYMIKELTLLWSLMKIR